MWKTSLLFALLGLIAPQTFSQKPCDLSHAYVAFPEATFDARPWIDGVIPYEFDSAVTSQNRARMFSAMQRWEALFSVNFKERGKENDYVVIQNGSANYAYVGRKGGKQFVTIFDWSFQSVLIHELGHTIGFWHEQQRPDRDTYVTIHWDNIVGGTTGINAINFKLMPFADGLGKYDFDSIMHYPAFIKDKTIAKDPNKPVITVQWPNQAKQSTMGNAIVPSAGDILGCQTVYGSIRIRRVSVDSVGTQANQGSGPSRISADGRYVAFSSGATNLVFSDSNGFPDVFVYDLKTGIMERVSVDSSGKQANGTSFVSDISKDGRYVLFASYASNLVTGDTNGVYDVFIRDRQTMTTIRVSVDSNGNEGDKASFLGAISSDGNYIAFESDATNLVSKDTNGASDVFVRDRQTNQTIRVSVSSGGAQANNSSTYPDISADGRMVVFYSGATNLVNGDTNTVPDIFLHDTVRGSTIRVSVSSKGAQANGSSVTPSISGDSRYITFSTQATNLGPSRPGMYQIYIHDLLSSTTSIISANIRGEPANEPSTLARISNDGRYVTFQSYATNLTGAPNTKPRGVNEIFIHDRQKNDMVLISVNSHGGESNNGSLSPDISGNGSLVTFYSTANNLVYSDTNGFPDIFVHEIEPWRMSSIPALASQIGKPCQGTRGLPMLYLDKTWPRIGNTAFTLAVDNAELNTVALFGFALSGEKLGLGKCTLEIPLANSFFLTVVTDKFGKSVLPFPIPNDSWYRGFPLYFQGFVLDPKGEFLGIMSFTNGLKILLGD